MIDFTEIALDALTGDRWLLLVVDHFTGYVWGETFATKEAEPVASFVYKIYLEFGFPQKIGFDNGREFVNKVMEGLQGYE